MNEPEFPSTYKSREGYRAIQAWYDHTLAQLSIPLQSQYIPTDFGETHLLELGDRGSLPLVLLPPLSANALMWSPHFDALSQHFRLIVPDIIGMTGRSAPARLSYKSDDHAHWLKAVLDDLGLEKVNMVGMAFGAWLAMKFGALYPQNIDRAVLLNPAGIVGIRLTYLLPLIPKILFLTDERARALSRQMLAPPDVEIDDTIAEFFYLVLKHFKSTNEAPPLSHAQLSAFQAETLMLVSEHEDVFDVDKLVARAESIMPDVTMDIIPGAPHGISLTHADVANRQIIEFLKR